MKDKNVNFSTKYNDILPDENLEIVDIEEYYNEDDQLIVIHTYNQLNKTE